MRETKPQKMKRSFLAAAVLLIISSCTENERAKDFGGTATVDLPAGQKLVTVTWKEGNNLWYLTKPMTSIDVAETYSFQEESSWGMWEGTVVIKETK